MSADKTTKPPEHEVQPQNTELSSHSNSSPEQEILPGDAVQSHSNISPKQAGAKRRRLFKATDREKAVRAIEHGFASRLAERRKNYSLFAEESKSQIANKTGDRRSLFSNMHWKKDRIIDDTLKDIAGVHSDVSHTFRSRMSTMVVGLVKHIEKEYDKFINLYSDDKIVSSEQSNSIIKNEPSPFDAQIESYIKRYGFSGVGNFILELKSSGSENNGPTTHQNPQEKIDITSQMTGAGLTKSCRKWVERNSDETAPEFIMREFSEELTAGTLTVAEVARRDGALGQAYRRYITSGKELPEDFHLPAGKAGRPKKPITGGAGLPSEERGPEALREYWRTQYQKKQGKKLGRE